MCYPISFKFYKFIVCLLSSFSVYILASVCGALCGRTRLRGVSPEFPSHIFDYPPTRKGGEDLIDGQQDLVAHQRAPGGGPRCIGAAKVYSALNK